MKTSVSVSIILLVMICILSCKKENSSATELYFPKVKTIVQNNCLSCHSSAGTWTGRPVVFDNDSEIVAAYQSIKAAVADSATLVNKRMPQGSTLSQSDIDIIVKWYNKGGKATD